MSAKESNKESNKDSKDAEKVALVTGGAVRVGRAIALELAAQGYDIALHYHGSQQAAEETAELIKQTGQRVLLLKANLSDEQECKNVLAQACELGSITVLINSAAVFLENDTLNDSLEHWDQVMNLNLKAPLLLSQAFAQQSIKDGHIINLLDARLNKPGGDHLIYRLSKSGLWHLTESLAQELAPKIQVNGIALGAILPPPGADENHFKRMEQHIPLRRTGSPSAISDTVMFLLAQKFITGTIIPVDGGEFL